MNKWLVKLYLMSKMSYWNGLWVHIVGGFQCLFVAVQRIQVRNYKTNKNMSVFEQDARWLHLWREARQLKVRFLFQNNYYVQRLYFVAGQ